MKTGEIFDFYEVNIEYIKYIYQYDSEVYYKKNLIFV
jgi:hypothetical protein